MKPDNLFPFSPSSGIPTIGEKPLLAWHTQVNGKNLFLAARSLEEAVGILRAHEIQAVSIGLAGEMVQ